MLLLVWGAITLRAYIHRRRRRRLEEEARRNGTYFPSAPPVRVRPPRVELGKKPDFWEAYLGRGSTGRKKEELDTCTNWKSEYRWHSIKPIYAGYAEPLTCDPKSDSTTSSSPPVFIPSPTSAPRVDDEENQRTAEVSTGPTPGPSLLTRATRIFLNPNSTVPASSSADNRTNSRENVSTTELNPNLPVSIRVAVLIAMPRASPSSHGSSSTPLSASKAHPTTSHSLELSSPSLTTLRMTDDEEEQPLPLLVMGVADVAISRSGNSSTWDRGVRTKGEEKTTHSGRSSYAEPKLINGVGRER